MWMYTFSICSCFYGHRLFSDNGRHGYCNDSISMILSSSSSSQPSPSSSPPTWSPPSSSSRHRPFHVAGGRELKAVSRARDEWLNFIQLQPVMDRASSSSASSSRIITIILVLIIIPYNNARDFRLMKLTYREIWLNARRAESILGCNTHLTHKTFYICMMHNFKRFSKECLCLNIS